MSNEIKRLFEEAQEDIGQEKPKRHHYPLLDILKTLSGNGRAEFNDQALQENGIDPHAFMQAWAEGFAKETLTKDPTFSHVRETILNRCKTCLEGQFKGFLSEATIAKLEAKRAPLRSDRNSPYPDFTA